MLRSRRRGAGVAPTGASVAPNGAPVSPNGAAAAHAAAAAPGAHVPTTVEPAGGGGRPDHEAALRAAGPDLDVDLDEPLYTEDDAIESLRLFRPIRYGQEEEVAPGIHATYYDAGHILGSAIVRLRVVDRAGDPEFVSLVFSGDLGRHDTPIINDPTPMGDADYVLCESTYGRARARADGRSPPDPHGGTVQLVAKHEGVLLVPAFAIGRTQELVWELDRLVAAGAIPALPLYLDLPMATRATDVYRRHAEYFDDTTRGTPSNQGETPLDYPKQHIVRDMAESQAIARAPRPYIEFVAANGMLTGGPRRRTPPEPDRRSRGDHPVRRLPGRRNPGPPPAGRRPHRAARWAGAGRALPHRLDLRLLRARRRIRGCPGLAPRVHQGWAPRRPRAAEAGLPCAR